MQKKKPYDLRPRLLFFLSKLFRSKLFVLFEGAAVIKGSSPMTVVFNDDEASKSSSVGPVPPKDTVSVKFRTATDIRKTLAKKSFKSKSHARQSQIINLIHQRVRAAYQNAKDPQTKKRLKIAYDYAKKRKEASKKKTERLRKKK